MWQQTIRASLARGSMAQSSHRVGDVCSSPATITAGGSGDDVSNLRGGRRAFRSSSLIRGARAVGLVARLSASRAASPKGSGGAGSSGDGSGSSGADATREGARDGARDAWARSAKAVNVARSAFGERSDPNGQRPSITSNSDAIDPRHLLTAQQEAEVRAAFFQLASIDGRLEGAALSRALCMLGMQPEADEASLGAIVDKLLASVGATRSTYLDYTRFGIAMANRILQYDAEEEVRQAFKLLFHHDDDASLVQLSHVRELLTSAGSLPLSEHEIDELFQLADPGRCGRVSIETLERLECWYQPWQKL